MSLILKSNKVYTGVELERGLSAYIDRVQQDGGEIMDMAALKDVFLFARMLGLDESKVFSATSVNWGVKKSGGNITKLYSLFDSDGDMEVANNGSMPYIKENGYYKLKIDTSLTHYLFNRGKTGNKGNIALAISATNSSYSPNLRSVAGLTEIGITDTWRVVLRVDQSDSQVATKYFGTTVQHGVVRDASLKSMGVHYSDGQITSFADGDVKLSSSAVPDASPNVSLVLGKYAENVNAALMSGYMTEAWAVVDVNPETFLNVCERMKHLYV